MFRRPCKRHENQVPLTYVSIGVKNILFTIANALNKIWAKIYATIGPCPWLLNRSTPAKMFGKQSSLDLVKG